MNKLERYGPPALFILVSLVTAGFFGYVATTRALTTLESFVWQFLSLLIGLIGSFIFGRQSAQKAAREFIKLSSRSAFRRLLSLYESISRVAYTIESAQSSESPDDFQLKLAELEGIVFMQLQTASDALEDWRDIVPDEVKELQEKLSSDDTTGQRQ